MNEEDIKPTSGHVLIRVLEREDYKGRIAYGSKRALGIDRAAIALSGPHNGKKIKYIPPALPLPNDLHIIYERNIYQVEKDLLKPYMVIERQEIQHPTLAQGGKRWSAIGRVVAACEGCVFPRHSYVVLAFGPLLEFENGLELISETSVIALLQEE